MARYLFVRGIILLIVSTLCDTLNFTCDKNVVRCGCGRVPVGINARIVNGENSIPNSWPMMVSLRNNRMLSKHVCGGTILSESYVLTAAHCVQFAVYDIAIENISIAAGVHSLSQPDQIIRRVDKIILHPLWKELHTEWQYDIAILHLAEPLDLTPNSSISRTCIPPRQNTLEEMMQYPLKGTELVTIGWGRLNTSGAYPDILQQVTVSAMHHFDKVCANSIHDPSIHFCAGLYEGGKGEK
jgi:secreted trypsin-like serine protease